ncbi:MAG: hypothetical protein FJ109_03915 [Deltaproteobacteria bacterium]|nr:hypothetical protein [Deltaproteobacteria bacterium]
MPNAFVEWIEAPTRFTGASGSVQYCRVADILDVGNFTTVVISARAVAITTAEATLEIQTAMSKDAPDADWKTLTNGTLDIDTVGEHIATSKPSDAQPMWRWLRYKVGYASANFDVTIILSLLLRETNS